MRRRAAGREGRRRAARSCAAPVRVLQRLRVAHEVHVARAGPACSSGRRSCSARERARHQRQAQQRAAQPGHGSGGAGVARRGWSRGASGGACPAGPSARACPSRVLGCWPSDDAGGTWNGTFAQPGWRGTAPCAARRARALLSSRAHSRFPLETHQATDDRERVHHSPGRCALRSHALPLAQRAPARLALRSRRSAEAGVRWRLPGLMSLAAQAGLTWLLAIPRPPSSLPSPSTLSKWPPCPPPPPLCAPRRVRAPRSAAPRVGVAVWGLPRA